MLFRLKPEFTKVWLKLPVVWMTQTLDGLCVAAAGVISTRGLSGAPLYKTLQTLKRGDNL